jgi:glycosyltransferase involved in cell wall biosynthesis
MPKVNKSILMIAYGFPPEGNAGVYRPLRFLRQLAHMNWRASVISVDAAQYERYDDQLLNLIPPGTKVIRPRSNDAWRAFQARRAHKIQKLSSKSVEVAAQLDASHRAPIRSFLRGAIRKAEAWCYHPDAAMAWIGPAVKAGVAACEVEHPNAIWATAGPVSSLVVAAKVSRRTGIPYVLDFRDAWTITYNEFEESRPNWARAGDWNRMRLLLKGAQSVVFLYDTMAECFWQAYPGAMEASRIHIIPNGYEGEIESSRTVRGDNCRLLYVGTLSSYRYDTLLKALALLKERYPQQANLLRLTFIGESMDELGRQVDTMGLHGMVEISPPIMHAEIVKKQKQADAFLLLGRPQTMSGFELFASAKLFGYMKSGRPIIGVLPSDEARKILGRIGVSTIADSESPEGISSLLHQLIAEWQQNQLPLLRPDPTLCEAFSAERQTEALVRALQGIPPSQPFVPGSVEIPPSLSDVIAARNQFCSEIS